MTRFHRRLLWASMLAFSVALPATAAPTMERLENSLTAGGLNVAPRYLDRPGDIDLNLLGGLVNYPTSEASLAGGQVSFQARLTDRLLFMANMGPLNEIGLRGPIDPFAPWLNDWKLGWAAHYRSDLYFTTLPTTGLAAPMGDMLPGSLAQGLELKLNTMRSAGLFNVYLSPVLGLLSNRTMGGMEGGLDLNMGPLGLGYGLSARANLVNPAEGQFAISKAELQHSVGLRLSLNGWTYLQANYYYMPNDTYGLPMQTMLAGIGTRLFYAPPEPSQPVSTPMPEPTATPESTPVPTPEPTPIPTPEPLPTPMPTPDPSPTPTPRPTASPVTERPPLRLHVTRLEGRLFSTMLPEGRLGRPVTVNLKRKVGRAFVGVVASTRTDALGRFVFHNVLPEGEYQVVFRNQEGLPNLVGVAVSDAVRIAFDHPVTVNMDLAWDDSAFRERLAGRVETITWGAKSSTKDAVYQGILRSNPNDSKTDLLPFPTVPTAANRGSFGVSSQVKGRKLYYFVKYWKRGGSFNGSSYYGQSKPRVLRMP